jgi:methionyl-tRNA formyltransferase
MLYRGIRYLFAVSKQDQILFFGSGKVALPSLRHLHQNYPKLQVVTQSSLNQKKVFNEVENYCEEHKLQWCSPITSKDSKEKRQEEWTKYLESLGQPDIGVVCSYGYMLPSRLIDRFKNGLIVIHQSLLPKYRGGAPIFHAIAHGEETSGVSYIEISKGAFDEGRILHQVETKLNRKDDYCAIEEQLAQLGANNLSFVLDNLEELRPGRLQEELRSNVPDELLKAPLPKSKKVELSQSAEQVYNMMRAVMTPKFRLKAKDCEIIIKVADEFKEGEGEVGSLQAFGKKLFVRCGDKFLRVTGWYEPSRREMNAGIFIAEFLKSGKYPLDKFSLE